jgi:hypothetical protein
MMGLQGPNLSVVTACTTANHSIGEAGRLIEYGDPGRSGVLRLLKRVVARSRAND